MQRRAFLALGLLAGTAILTLPLAAKDPVGAPAPVSEFVWSHPEDKGFGGFSAIEVSDNGQSFIALSDSGAFVRGQVQRNASGGIVSVTADGPTTPLLNERGTPLGPDFNDTEGLAVMADGTAFVSSEGPARVLRYADLGGKATALAVPGEFRGMQKNSSLEALAVAPDGTLYTLPERSGRVDRPFPVFRFRDGAWEQPFAMPRDGTLLPVAADIGPDGRLYVLEREFLGLAGFRMRLRSFAIGDTALTDERRLLETQTGRHGNLEGVSVWRNASGHLIATMISDDNFEWFLATEIVEYDLGSDGLGLPAG
jgi:hypothetical protein